MKKTVGTLIAILLICCLLPIPVQAAESSAPITEYRTSYNENDYYKFSVSGDRLTVSGVISERKTDYLIVLLSEDQQSEFGVEAGVTFSASYNIKPYQKDGEVKVAIAAGEKKYGTYYYVFYDQDVVLTYSGGAWGFEFPSKILENNLSYYEEWVNPGDALGAIPEKEIASLATGIVGNATDDYEKMCKIHDWVAQKLYYNYDVAEGKAAWIEYKNVYDIIKKENGVCGAYAELTQALLQAQNIPCMMVYGVTPEGTTTSAAWTLETMQQTEADHVWNEAFVNGRWIVLDVTWDSGNQYIDGQYIYGGVGTRRYLDISQEQLSKDHKIIYWPEMDIIEYPAGWAKSEIKDAFSHELIPYELQQDYSSKITRKEFCAMAVQLIEAKEAADIKAVLEEKGLSSTSVFKDTSDEAVLAAYALGIVKGKGNGLFVPNGEITRQEAAVMLEKTAKVLGLNELEGAAAEFADSEKFASWAADSIGFVSALSDVESGNLVMGGVGEGKFSPGSAYTREQSCCTMLRLYHVLTQMKEIEGAVAS